MKAQIWALPTAGEIVFFELFWFSRAGVERVTGFCTAPEYPEFLRETPEREPTLVRSGTRRYKCWFSLSRDEQFRRLRARETDALKKRKLSPIDMASLDQWDHDTEAREAMFSYADTSDAPWAIVKSDDRKSARLNCMRHVLASPDCPGKDHAGAGQPDLLIIGPTAQLLHTAAQMRDTDPYPPGRP